MVNADRLLRLSCPVTIRFSTVVAEFRDSRMAFNELTQRIVNQVEEASGRPVIVQADSTVRVAALILARGSAPAHVVKYNPALGAEADYAICFQCGLALRIFLVPAAERFDVYTSSRGYQECEAISSQHFQKVGMAIPAPIRSQLLRQFVHGLIVQLRSMPIALRVDDWLRRDYPELVEQQKIGNVRQLNENVTCLRPDVGKQTPKEILRPNIAMNAAFAGFWSRTWADPLVVVPYKTSANLADGQALLKIWNEIPNAPTNDRQLIEAWGDYLNLGDWYEVAPFA